MIACLSYRTVYFNFLSLVSVGSLGDSTVCLSFYNMLSLVSGRSYEPVKSIAPTSDSLKTRSEKHCFDSRIRMDETGVDE